MHFSIPDTKKSSDNSGNSFSVFNIHVNGVFHCSIRYSQIYQLHEQLKKQIGTGLPPFPPKKLLSLNEVQLEERRCLLERYIQIVSQDPNVSSSETFINFLLNAQQMSQNEVPVDVTLDVYLMNGHKISVNIVSTDQTDDVLEAVATSIELPDEMVYYFGLFLMKKEESYESSIIRNFQEFESPYISLKTLDSDNDYRIVLRKCYWDVSFDDILLTNRIALNLLYLQCVNDIERGWVVGTKEQHKQLQLLQQKGSKHEFLKLCRVLKFHGYMQFKPCITDYPHPECRAIISAGNKELYFRIQTEDNKSKEASFKVTRMRCWRITSNTQSNQINGNHTHEHSTVIPSSLEISFEYLIAKDTLRWVNVNSDQAILISMCLQGMVDELLRKKQNQKIKQPGDRLKTRRLKAAPTTNILSSNANNSRNTPTHESPSFSNKASGKLFTSKLSGSTKTSSQEAPSFTDNDAFEGIGDDDL